MTNEENLETERNYSFNWLSLLIKVVIFAILLVLLIWVLSRFASGTKKCQTKEEDYYVVSTYSDSSNENEYRYTIKLLNIDTNNSKDVSLKTYNYFHNDKEYEDYIKNNNDNVDIINQTNNDLVVDNRESLKNSSLTANEFTYDISDIYTFEDNYYIDITINIKDHSNITPYANNYFIPIHLVIDYTETDNCKAK